MIEQSLFQSNFIGRDGFNWWIGQVADPKTSGWSKAATFVEKDDAQYYRVKVRILGYHPPSKEDLPDDKLPFAHVTVPLGAGTGVNNIGELHNIQGGESVFGFFMDGDDGQQPVILGAFYRQSYQNDDLEIGEDIPFKRFSGPKNNDQYNLHTIRRPIISGGVNVATGTTSTNPIPSPKKPGVPEDITQALALHAANSSNPVVTPSPCKDNDISRIKNELIKFMNDVRKVQAFQDLYVNPIYNKLVNLDDIILSYSKIILGIVSGQINKSREWLLEYLGDELGKSVGNLFPKSQHPIASSAIRKVSDLIFCLFEQLIESVLNWIIDALTSLLGDLFDIVQCLVDNFLFEIFSQIQKFITENLSPILEQINQVLGPILGTVGDVINQTLQYSGLVLSFINGCDDTQCPTPSVWTPGEGPNFGLLDDFDKLLSQLNGKDFGPCDPGLVCGVELVIGGGGGFGAIANAIVNGNGQIVGTQILNGGTEYFYPPRITAKDNCGGYGAEFSGTISNGSLIGITIENPGQDYTPTDSDIGVKPEDPTDPGTGSGNKCGYICGVYVKKIGFNYSVGDTITVLNCDGSEVPEVQMKLIIGPNNSIVDVQIISSAVFCDCLPELVINTVTGSGAVLVPQLCFGDDIPEFPKGADKITVIDCISK